MASPIPAIKPYQEAWLKKLTALPDDHEASEKREKISDDTAKALAQNAEEIRSGFNFEIDKLDTGAIAFLKKKAGLKNTMKSMDKRGNAQKEIDTGHDLKKLKSISPDAAKKALAAMDKLSEISEETRDKLRARMFEEAGYPKARRKELDDARSELKKTGKLPKGVTEKDLKDFRKACDRISEELDEAVAQEVWSPLVRQGVIPENLVPDRYSNVKKTFAAAAEAYNERLVEYSKGLDEHDGLIKALGVSQAVIDQATQIGQNILQAVPGGEVTEAVGVAIKLLPIVSSGVTNAAIQVLQRKDAQDVVDGLLNTAASACSAALPGDLAAIVNGSIKGAIAGGRAVRALVEGNPDSFLDSLATAVDSALSTAADASGNKELADMAPAIVGSIKSGASAARVVKAYKSGNKDAIKAAVTELLNGVVNTIGAAAKAGVDQGVSDPNQASTTNMDIDLATTTVSSLITAALSENKVAGFAAAMGSIANQSCKDFVEPPALGSSLGALINSAIGTDAGKVIEGIKKKNPVAVLEAFTDVTVQSLQTASAGVKNPDQAQALSEAAAYLGNSMATFGSAVKLAKAVRDQDLDGIDKASQELFVEMAAYVKTAMPEYADVDVEVDSDGGDSGKDASGDDKQSDEDKQAAAKIKAEIAKQNKILKDPNAKPKDKEAAMEAKAKAVEELAARRETAKELTKDQETFNNLLGMGMAEEEGDPDDEGFEAPKLQQLIVQLQRDQQIFALVEKLSAMPVAIAAQFFPPAGIAVEFQKFCFEVMKAVQHTRLLLQWMDNAKDAKSAVSVQMHAMLSRVHMENRRLAEHNARAALALTAAIGHVVTTFGAHAAPAGVAITASAKAGSATLEIIKIVYDQAEMEAGWRIFKAAMKDPRDRKIARKAIEANPTLAKYCLAWGAVSGNDPIAKEALRKCGITDAVLKDEEANVQNVQKYLEVMFNEDLVILRAVPVPKKWYPADQPVLTLRSWAAFLSAAQKSADLAPNGAGAISQQFAAMEDGEALWKKADQEFKTAEEAFLSKVDGTVKAELAQQAEAARKEREAAQLEKAEGASKKKPAAEPKDKKAGRTQAEITKEARKKAGRPYNKAKREADAAKTNLKVTIGAFKKAARAYGPVTTKGAEHVEMAEYVDALVALADLRLRDLKGETVALERAAAA